MNKSRFPSKINFKGSNVLAVGTDIVYIPRLEKMLLRNEPQRLNKIMRKFMHQREIEQFHYIALRQNIRSQATYLSGIWAIKESLFKCLPNEKSRPPAIHIYTRLGYKSKNDQGQPKFNLDMSRFITPSTQEYWNKYIKSTRFILSLSHDQDYLVCFMMHVHKAQDDCQKVLKST